MAWGLQRSDSLAASALSALHPSASCLPSGSSSEESSQDGAEIASSFAQLEECSSLAQAQAQAQGLGQGRGRLEQVRGSKGKVGALFSSPPRAGRRFKGVRQRRWGRFQCEIRDAIGKRIWLGSYDTEEEAARVYDMAARILQGEGAWLNYPHEAPGPVTLPKATLRSLLKHRGNLAHRLQRGSLARVSHSATNEPPSPSTASQDCGRTLCKATSVPSPSPLQISAPTAQPTVLRGTVPVSEAQAPVPAGAAGEAGQGEGAPSFLDWILEDSFDAVASHMGEDGSDGTWPGPLLDLARASAQASDCATSALLACAEDWAGADGWNAWRPGCLWNHDDLGTVELVAEMEC